MSRFKAWFSVWRRTVFARTLLFSVCTLIPVLSAGWAISAFSQNTLYDQIVALSSSQVSGGMALLRGEIDKLQALESELLFDTDINRLGVTPGYYTVPQSTPAMLRVVERMRLLEGSSTLVSRAMFLAPAIGKSIEQSGVETLDEAFFKAASEEYIATVRNLVEISGEYYMLIPYPTYTTYLRSYGASYLICVQLDKQALYQFLRSLTAQDDECVMLLTQEHGALSSVNAAALGLDTQRVYELAQGKDAFDVTAEAGESYIAVASRDSAVGLTLVKLMPKKRVFASLQNQRSLFILLFLLAIALNLLYDAWQWRDIHKPLRVLSGAFEQVEKGVLSTRIHHRRGDEFSGIYERFNHMNERLEELIEQVYKQTIRTQRAELKQLQSQINPHFLYNSFFMLKSFARIGDCDAIERMTDELGEYFRYVTRNGEEEVALAREVAHARNYAAIQDMRFSSRIKLRFEALPKALEDVRVPRLILQPLIENAYSHGLAQTADKGELAISFVCDEESARVTVEDSGEGLTDEALTALGAQLEQEDAPETTALINIHRRLRLFFGAPYGLTITRSALGGLCVTLTIPTGGKRLA